MRKRYVIARKYLPIRPVTPVQLATLGTLLHYWQAPGWVWGIVGTLVGILTLSSWCIWWSEKEVSPSRAEAWENKQWEAKP